MLLADYNAAVVVDAAVVTVVVTELVDVSGPLVRNLFPRFFSVTLPDRLLDFLSWGSAVKFVECTDAVPVVVNVDVFVVLAVYTVVTSGLGDAGADEVTPTDTGGYRGPLTRTAFVIYFVLLFASVHSSSSFVMYPRYGGLVLCDLWSVQTALLPSIDSGNVVS